MELISVISRLSSPLSARTSDVRAKDYSQRAEEVQLMTLLTIVLTVQMVMLIHATRDLGNVFKWDIFMESQSRKCEGHEIMVDTHCM